MAASEEQRATDLGDEQESRPMQHHAGFLTLVTRVNVHSGPMTQTTGSGTQSWVATCIPHRSKRGIG